MGARKLTVQDPSAIIEDMPERKVVGRDRRKAEYQAERREREAAKDKFPPVEPYPGHMPPEVMFPEWDWEGAPWGPPLEDPAVMAYCNLQWRLFLKHTGTRQRA